MALPFPILDHDRRLSGYVWCLRCEDWIPLKDAYGGAGAMFDPHIQDHLQAYSALRQLHADDQ